MKSSRKSIVIRPFSSKKGLSLLIIFLLIGLFFASIVLFIYIIAPAGEAKAGSLMSITGIMSVTSIIAGITFYFVFPAVKIIFDSSMDEVITKRRGHSDTVIPFSRLQPFRIYEQIRGYAHQYYCCNASFGEYSDLFFTSLHGKTLEKAKRLAALTGAVLIDYNGEEI